MTDSSGHDAYRIAISISLAFTLHVVTAILATVVAPEQEVNRTVPTVILDYQRASSTTSSQARQQESNQTIVSTISESALSSPKSDPQTEASAQKLSTSDHTGKSLQQMRRQTRARTGIKEIFSQQHASKSSSQIKQISTKQAPLLSEYQIALREHMLQAELYDHFHNTMRSKQQDSISYTIELSLLANGAIRNATIKESSGDDTLDRQAITAAYNASPYPRPPEADMALGFRYSIQIRYKQNPDIKP